VQLSLQPATINADATQVRQVVMNLVTNASDALQENEGVVHIRVGIKRVDASQLISCYTSNELPAGDYAYFQVEDSGCGMDEETLEFIFDPFYTTKFAGRGLCLAAVLGIIRGHRGTINVTSELGRGSSFEVLIPCAHATTTQRNYVVQEPPPKGRGVVLVVDDEPTVRDLAERVLQDAGFCVLLAKDGRQALESLETHREEIDVMLLDLIMPRMDGPEVLRQLQIRSPDLPVVLMSGYGEQELASRLAESRANGFIQKPFRASELVESICQLLPSAT
jgi:CheY-like chemotaxis protein